MLKVATKIDKVSRSRRVQSLRAIRERLQLADDVELIPFSSVSGEGTKLLWRGITDFLDGARES